MMAVRSLASCLLTAVAVAIVGAPGKASAQDSPVASLVGEVDLAVDSVEIVEGQVVANTVLTLEIAGRTLTQEIPIPLEVGALSGEVGECDALTLSLEPVDQTLAGLVVELDDCDGGPVLFKIQPFDDDDGPGDLVCDVAGMLLVEGADPATVLAGLPAEEAVLLSLTLADVLDQTFVTLLEQGLDDSGDEVAIQSSGKGKGGDKGKGKSKGKGKGKGPGKGDDDHDDDDDSGKGSKRVELAELQLEGLVDEEMPGLFVTTTDVCLEIYAEGGKGNLLGNMLRQLDHLMSRPGNTAKAQKAILKNLRRALMRLEALSL